MVGPAGHHPLIEGSWRAAGMAVHPSGNRPDMLYTILVIIAAIVLAVIVLNVIRSGGRTI